MGNPASFCKRLSTQPGRENVPCRVDIAIVRRSTAKAYPLPYSKICDTFRPRRREIPTRRTDLGTTRFVDFRVLHSVPAGLVAEHSSEGRPARVVHRLCHPCTAKLRTGNVPDIKSPMLTHEPRRELVKVILSHVRNLVVQRPHSLCL